MQIKRLRIAGFKSFVDPADLRIEPGLTGVVGPNGCGKSNLLEALRWTMGEGSPKWLRGAGMEDVIFAGTATRPPRDFAEVSILAEIGDDETEIVRRIERGAGSAYRIDGRDVRAKDVGLLFADAATGAHSPALVSQGRIGAVIAAKPADRRAMLEEAAGIAGLHVRRRDAEQKLRATEANLARLDELIADHGTRAAALRRQARAAERYRALSDQIRVAEARMIYARWQGAVAAADAAKAEAARADARVTEAAEAERAAAAYRAAAVEQVAAARMTALAARDRASEAGHRLATLRTERDGATRRLADLAATQARIGEDRAREGSLATDAAAALAALTDETKAIEARIGDAAAALPALDAALAEAERAGRDADVALAQGLAAQASDAAEAHVAAAALAAAETRAGRSGREAAELARAVAALGDGAAFAADRAAAATRRAAAADARADATDRLVAAERDEAAALAGRDAADAGRATATADLAALEAEVAALTRDTARAGGDTLLDHVRPASGYERALAAALGDDLATPLAAWPGAAPSPADPLPPPGTRALADTVTAPAALARRLAQVFVGTDTGQPLAAGQRLVTSEGALRRWDGFVATGSGAAAAARLERLNRLDALAAQRPATMRARDEAVAAHAGIEAAIQAARRMAREARTTQICVEADLRAATQAEDRAAAAIERLAAQRADLDARTARIATESHDAATERDHAREAVAALPDGAAARATVAALGASADTARTRVAQARGDRLATDRAVHAARERLAAAQAEARSWRSRAGDAARRIADLDGRAADIATEIEALAPRPATLAAMIDTETTAHTAARAEADTAAATERTAEATLRDVEATHARAGEALSAAREARAAATARVENQELRRVEMGRLSGERFACPAPLLPERLGFAAKEVGDPARESASHDRLMADRERIGPVNLVAEQELAALEASGAGNAAARADLGEAVARLRGSIGMLNREGRQRLRTAFEAVDAHFRTLFTTLFDGGSAHLAMVDSDDPLEAGLEIMAQPPGKRLQSLTLLSGGEQALTAVALIFALFLTNPAPICVLDEVDAPLDDANIERFCDLLDRMTRETQTRYLVVTHNAVTMSRMHRLFGVTMIEKGVSRLVSVDLRGAEGLLAAE